MAQDVLTYTNQSEKLSYSMAISINRLCSNDEQARQPISAGHVTAALGQSRVDNSAARALKGSSQFTRNRKQALNASEL